MAYTPALRLNIPVFDQDPWDYDVNSNWSIIDAAVGTFTAIPNMTGVWKNSTTYLVGQATVDASNATIWVCAIGHVSAASPTTFAADRAAQPANWVQSSTGGLYLPISGGTINGDLNVLGTTTSDHVHGNVLQAGGIEMYTLDPTSRVFAFSPDWLWTWDNATGALTWNAFSVGSFITFEVISTAPNWRAVNWLGPWYGNGAYVDTSDERLKTNIEPAAVGLDQILAITPIKFYRRDQNRVEIGFSAQQLAPIIPEAVVSVGTAAKDGPGSLASADPILGITSETIVAALVNGMKEQDARIRMLEKQLSDMHGGNRPA